MENATAPTAAGTLIATGVVVTYEITCARIMPTSTPMRPPRLVSTAASVRNCPRIRDLRAPIAFFRPISCVRSVTDTSMMFMTPIPPTINEMPAIQISMVLVELLSS